MDSEEAERKHQKQLERKRANFRAYYERNKEQMRERARQNYNPEQKRAYYQSRKDEIRDYNRNYYKAQRGIEYARRLDAIIAKCEAEPAFAAVFERIKTVASSLSEKELQLFESLVEIKEDNEKNAESEGNNSAELEFYK